MPGTNELQALSKLSSMTKRKELSIGALNRIRPRNSPKFRQRLNSDLKYVFQEKQDALRRAFDQERLILKYELELKNTQCRNATIPRRSIHSCQCRICILRKMDLETETSAWNIISEQIVSMQSWLDYLRRLE